MSMCMYMCGKTNTYAHLFVYTNIQMHGTLLLSTVSGPFASFLSLTLLFALLALFSCSTSLFLSASRFISLNIYDYHTFTYLLLITPPLSGDEFTGSKFLVSTAPPFFQLVALWYDSLYFSLLLAWPIMILENIHVAYHYKNARERERKRKRENRDREIDR